MTYLQYVANRTPIAQIILHNVLAIVTQTDEWSLSSAVIAIITKVKLYSEVLRVTCVFLNGVWVHGVLCQLVVTKVRTNTCF